MTTSKRIFDFETLRRSVAQALQAAATLEGSLEQLYRKFMPID
ncbi:hypothetical protein [Paraburkholderia kururiensis]|jgi:hypothetical protein|nr:hypothetical protein [Paraburkholderia kururiensis]